MPNVMFTWISKTGAALAACVMLAACLPTLPGSGAGVASRSMLVSAGAVNVTGPAGYCIDKGSSRDGAEGAFVLLGACAPLSASVGATATTQRALLTASVLPGVSSGPIGESFPIMAKFFRSPAGQAALSRSGDAKTVTVQKVASRNGVLYMQLSDTTKTSRQRVEPDYWRAILSIRGRMVTLSVLGLPGYPVPDAEKRKILDAFVAKMRAANPNAT